MKRLMPTVAILAFLILPQAAQAQLSKPTGFDLEEQLRKVEQIHVGVADSVKGGCLPSQNVLKVEAELILRRSGITVTDSVSFPAYILHIQPTGDELTGKILGCVGSIRIDLWRFELLGDQTDGEVRVAQDDAVFWGPKAGFQEQLRTFVNTATTALANKILKARTDR